MEVLKDIFTIVSGITGIIGLLAIFVKPIREKLFGLGRIKTGIMCEQKALILDIYYKHYDERTLTYYERQLLDALVESYVSLGGNSFVKDIYAEMCEWHVKK